VEVGGDVCEDGLLVGSVHVHVLGVEQLGDTEVALRELESVAEVGLVVGGVERGVVEEVGPLRVHESVEGEAVAPAAREVGHAHVRVAGRLALAPQQQGLFGAALVLRLVLELDLYVLDLEAEDYGPDETERERRVACHDVLGTDAL